MDQHAVKGQASLLFSTALYFRFYPVLTFQRRKKNLNKQHVLNLKIIAFFSLLLHTRAFQKTTSDLPRNEARISLALLQGLRLQLASYRFRLV